jgi:hypothetical protein
MPEPLPLWEGEEQDETNPHAGFRRATKIFKNFEDQGVRICMHEEVHDWKCLECKKRIS